MGQNSFVSYHDSLTIWFQNWRLNVNHLERCTLDILERSAKTESQNLPTGFYTLGMHLPTVGRRFSQGGVEFIKIKYDIKK